MVMHGSTKYIPRHVREQRETQQLTAPPPLASKPPTARIRAEVEPQTSAMTLYGESRPPCSPSTADPKSYKASEWKSVTHSHYQPLPYVATSKEIQNQRARFQMSSDLPLNEESLKVFDPSVGFAGKETQFKTDFRPLEREWYVNRPATYAIGGHGATDPSIGASRAGTINKHGGTTTGAVAACDWSNANPFSGRTTHSDVHLKESDKMEPHAYETLTKRQFQPYPVDKKAAAVDKARRWENKKDMVASHFVIGTDHGGYDTAAKVPLPSEKPHVKHAVQYASPMDSAHNPHIVTEVKDARPTGLTAKEVAYRKATSSVPVLTKNNPEYHRYGGAWPATSTQYATPTWNPNRQPGWQLFGNGLGGVRLGHEDHYEPNPDGTYSPKRHTDSTNNGNATQIVDGPLSSGGDRPHSSSQLGAVSHGRRSATPLLTGSGSAQLSGGVGASVARSHTSMGATHTSTGHPRNTDPRWVSASKASFKGFQYQQ